MKMHHLLFSVINRHFKVSTLRQPKIWQFGNTTLFNVVWTWHKK